jgi:hypothetical protein
MLKEEEKIVVWFTYQRFAISDACIFRGEELFLQNVGIYQITLRHIPEDSNLNIHLHDNLKCHRELVYKLVYIPSSTKLNSKDVEKRVLEIICNFV